MWGRYPRRKRACAIGWRNWALTAEPTVSRISLTNHATLRTAMMKRENFAVDAIYVPIKRRTTLDPKRVDEIAQSMLADGQKTPILVRPMARALSWSRACIGWRPPRRWASRPLSAFASTHGSIEIGLCDLKAGLTGPPPSDFARPRTPDRLTSFARQETSKTDKKDTRPCLFPTP